MNRLVSLSTIKSLFDGLLSIHSSQYFYRNANDIPKDDLRNLVYINRVIPLYNGDKIVGSQVCLDLPIESCIAHDKDQITTIGDVLDIFPSVMKITLYRKVNKKIIHSDDYYTEVSIGDSKGIVRHFGDEMIRHSLKVIANPLGNGVDISYFPYVP